MAKRKGKSKVLNTINKLQAQGHNVEYRARKDGGYLITKIDNVKYTGAKGNEAGRKLTGDRLSQAQVKQRRSNVKKYIKKPQLNAKIKKELLKVQRLERINKPNGKTTTKKIRWTIAHKGKAEALNILKRREAYAKGLAHENVVRDLADTIEATAQGFEGEKKAKLLALAEKVRTIKNFKEKWVAPLYAYLYDIHNDYDNAVAGIERVLSDQFIYIYGQLQHDKETAQTKAKKNKKK